MLLLWFISVLVFSPVTRLVVIVDIFFHAKISFGRGRNERKYEKAEGERHRVKEMSWYNQVAPLVSIRKTFSSENSRPYPKICGG